MILLHVAVNRKFKFGLINIPLFTHALSFNVYKNQNTWRNFRHKAFLKTNVESRSRESIYVFYMYSHNTYPYLWGSGTLERDKHKNLHILSKPGTP